MANTGGKTDINYCGPMNNPTCTDQPISGGGANSATIDAIGRCLVVANDKSNQVTTIQLYSTGVPHSSRTAYSVGGPVAGIADIKGIGISLFAAGYTPNQVYLLPTAGPGCALNTNGFTFQAGSPGQPFSLTTYP